ncbi:MAG TPA: hypothetical protein VFD59_20225 [Nocardioidaceae bacterium]|nr:hypothetical protein [Nocardioidaceae bacterium]
MTMSPVEMQRKVQQLDNDVYSIYEMLVSIQVTQQRHGNRIEELTGMVAAHDARFDAVDHRFDVLEGKVDTILDLLQGGRPSGH